MDCCYCIRCPCPAQSAWDLWANKRARGPTLSGSSLQIAQSRQNIDARRLYKLGDGYTLVWHVRANDVAGTHQQGRHVSDIDQQPQVRTIGFPFHLRRPPAYLLDALPAELHQGMVVRDLAALELAAGPGNLQGVILEPGISLGQSVQGSLELLAHLLSALAHRHADAPFKNQLFGDRGGPVAGLHAPDAQGIGQVELAQQWMRDVAVALTLQFDERAMDVQVFLDCADALQAHTGVRGYYRHAHGEGQRPRVGRHQVEAGWLTDNCGVPPVSTQERGEGAQTTIFFANHALDEQRTRQRHARILDGLDGVKRGD